MKGKVVIVTGAASGMGAATAALFARAGARVMLSDVNVRDGEYLAADLRAEGHEAAFIAADMRREAEVASLVARTTDVFGRLDCAVNNAAAKPDDKPLAAFDVEEFDRIMAVNLRAVALCMKYQIAHMLERGGGGAIVNIGSVSSERARRNNVAYVASKHAVIGLTKSGALEYGADGIRVNAVLPGTIDTPMIRDKIAERGLVEREVALNFSPMGRFGKPDEVAQASLWLCSDAASYVTGQALAVDGGYLVLSP